MNEIKNLTAEQLQAILEHAKQHSTRYIFGLSSTIFIFLKVKMLLKTKNEPPTLPLSLNRDERFEKIKKHRKNGILPKVFIAKERYQ